MAYVPPLGNAVDFAFGGAPYTPPAGNAVHFRFGGQAFGVNAAWLVAAPLLQRHGVDRRWATAAPARQSHGVNARWAAEVGGQSFGLSARWAVDAPAAQSHGVDAGWRTVAMGVGVAHGLNAQWAVDPVPQQIFGIDRQWATFSPQAQAAGVDGQWRTLAPAVTSLLVNAQWATALYSSAVFGLNDEWRFMARVARAWSIAYGSQVRRAWSIPYQLGRTRVARAWSIRYALTTRVAKAWSIKYAIETVDHARRAWALRYSILDGATITQATQPTVTVQGRAIKIDTAEVSFDEGQFAWTCQLTLVDPAHYSLFEADQEFTVTIGAEDYSFVCDERTFSRQGQVDINATIAGIGPAARFANPRADRVTKTWDTPMLVSSIVEELFGVGVVSWEIIDWSLPANRLAANNQTPMEIIQPLAAAAGGLVESDPDGSIHVRYAYPVSVPFYASTQPDLVYDDVRDAFTVAERGVTARITNLIRILDVGNDLGAVLMVELDSREDGLNGGRTSFLPGEQPGFLIFKGDDVTVSGVRPSAGNIADIEDGTIAETELLHFADTQEATLKRPALAGLTSYKWLGNDLGVPVVQDQIKVVVPLAGVGVLQVTYDSAFDARRLSGLGVTLNGESEFEVLVLVEGSQQ